MVLASAVKGQAEASTGGPKVKAEMLLTLGIAMMTMGQCVAVLHPRFRVCWARKTPIELFIPAESEVRRSCISRICT